MNFSITTFQTSFLVNLVPSNETVNFPNMPEGKYDWKKNIVFGSMKDVKKYLKESIATKKLSEIDRYYLNQEIKELTLEKIVDEELEAVAELEKELIELRKQVAELKSEKAA